MKSRVQRMILLWIALVAGAQTPLLAASGEWTTFTNANFIYDLAAHGSTLWLATNGGLVEFDLTTGSMRKYTNVDGLADIDLRAVGVDSSGNVWCGASSRGLSVLSGRDGRWTTYTRYHGLPGSTIYSLAALGDTIWVGTDAGLWVLKTQGTIDNPEDDQSFTYNTGNGLVQNSVRTIAFQNDYLWLGTDGGVNRVKRSQIGTPAAWARYTTQDGLAGNRVRSIAAQNDTVWAGTDQGVSRLANGIWSTSLAGVDGRDLAILDSLVWYATPNGMRRFDGTSWLAFNTGLVTLDCRALAVDSRDSLWVGLGSGDGRESHGRGFALWQGSQWRGYESDGVPDNAVVNIQFEEGGRVWVSTAYGGAGVWDGSTWTNFHASDGLASDQYLYGLAIDHRNRKWFGTWGVGVSRVEDQGTADKSDDRWTTLTPQNSGLSGIHVPVIFVDPGGNIYFGSQGPPNWTPYPGGVDRLSADTLTWTTFDLTHQGAWNVAKAIITDGEGRLWIGVESFGLLRLDDRGTPSIPGDDIWESFTMADGLVNNSVWAMASDPVGGMWFGTNGGISLYENHTFRNFTSAGGLPGEVVRGVALDSQGNKYFGLVGGGLCRLDRANQSWTFYTQSNSGLVFDDVGVIRIRSHDAYRDELWIATDRGLSRFVPANPPPTSLAETWIYPNPFRPGRGDREITFANLPDNSVLRVFTLSAERVREVSTIDLHRHALIWDGRNEAGRVVASGVYPFVITSPAGSRTGKVCVIR